MLLGEGPNSEPLLVPILGTTERTFVVVFLHEEALASLESLRMAKFQFVRTRTTTIDTTFTDNFAGAMAPALNSETQQQDCSSFCRNKANSHHCWYPFNHEEASASLESLRMAKFQFVGQEL